MTPFLGSMIPFLGSMIHFLGSNRFSFSPILRSVPFIHSAVYAVRESTLSAIGWFS
jgi:hypothetical protein